MAAARVGLGMGRDAAGRVRPWTLGAASSRPRMWSLFPSLVSVRGQELRKSLVTACLSVSRKHTILGTKENGNNYFGVKSPL